MYRIDVKTFPDVPVKLVMSFENLVSTNDLLPYVYFDYKIVCNTTGMELDSRTGLKMSEYTVSNVFAQDVSLNQKEGNNDYSIYYDVYVVTGDESVSGSAELEARKAILEKHGYRVKAIEVMDASRRTTKLNAYFTGFGKMKTIVLFDNLINAMTPEEICAVFAHELGHGLYKDVLKRQIMNLGNLLLMAVVVWLAVREPQLHEAFGFAQVNYGFAYILLGIGLGMVQPLTGMLMNSYSRAAEYRADRQAVQEGYGESLITGLKILAKENFAHLAPAKLQVVLEYSHPPLSQRIEAIEQALTK